MAKKAKKKIGPHPKARKGARCTKCGKTHTKSEHWSHRVEHKKNWFGKGERPFGKKTAAKKRKAKKSGSATKRTTTRAQRSAANKRAHAAKRKQHRVKAHLAANAGRKPGQHRVKAHLAKMPTKTKKPRRKKHPRASVKALQKYNASMRRASRDIAKRAKIPSANATRLLSAGRLPGAWQGEAPAKVVIVQAPARHAVRGHLAANAGRKPGQHHVRAHKARNPKARAKVIATSGLPRVPASWLK